MVWNPSREVAVARDAAARLGADRCIIIYTTPDQKLGCASFGKTKALCADAKAAADILYTEAMDYVWA